MHIRSVFISIALGSVLGPAATGFGQETQAEPPVESQRQAHFLWQTGGPPPEYSLRDVVIRLDRALPSGQGINITLSGVGQTLYAGSQGAEGSREKAESLSMNDLFLVLQKAYELDIFALDSKYEGRAFVRRDSLDRVTTHYAQPQGGLPSVSLRIRIGDYEKEISALDLPEHSGQYNLPGNLFEFVEFVDGLPAVKRLMGKLQP